MTEDADFKGYIHDVGGPTANFRHPSCEKQLTRGYVRTGSAFSRNHVRIWMRITQIMWLFCASSGRCRK